MFKFSRGPPGEGVDRPLTKEGVLSYPDISGSRAVYRPFKQLTGTTLVSGRRLRLAGNSGPTRKLKEYPGRSRYRASLGFHGVLWCGCVGFEASVLKASGLALGVSLGNQDPYLYSSRTITK